MGAILFTCAWLLAAPRPAPVGSSVVVTAADSRGAALSAVHVVVNGVLGCEATPCRLELPPGAHQFEVVSHLTKLRAARSLSVAQGEHAALHFAFSAAPAGARAPAPETAEASSDDPISVNALPEEVVLEGEARHGSVPPRAEGAPHDRPARAASLMPGLPLDQVGKSTATVLNLNSIPISSVVLDGRPIGSTPLVGVEVSPGTHTVAFVHHELGRRSADIQIGSGERKTVVVRLERVED